MTAGPGYRLGIDFGTSHTVAVTRRPDGTIRPLLFDGSPLLPSGVTGHGAELATGADARHLAEVHPDAHEPAPKARVDEGSVVLAGREIEVCDLVAAVLRRVREEAERAGPLPAGGTVLTVPAAWAAHRRGLLVDAAARAGMPGVTLLPEPVAAAAAILPGRPDLARDGATALVYDLGAGTFDATVLRRRGPDLDVLHTAGLTDAGGADIDEAVVAFLGTVWGDRQPDAWTRLTTPRTDADRRDRRRLWESVRTAKEMLSRQPVSIIRLPGTDADATLDRATLDRLAGSLVRRTVRAARTAVTAAGLNVGDVDAVLLVGGASRMPLVSHLLAAEFGRPPVAVDQPELVVARGSLAGPPPATVPPPPVDAPDAVLSASPMTPRTGRRRRTAWTAGVAAALLLLAGTAVGVALNAGRRPGGTGSTGSTWVAASTTPSTAPTAMSPSLKAFVGVWASDLPCLPVGFEGPFDVAATGIRAELIERFRCDITSGPGQGVTVYFGYFSSAVAHQALRDFYGARTSGWSEFTYGGNRVIMWWETGLRGARCLGWVQAPTAALTRSQLSTVWYSYQDRNRAAASASASASPR